MGLGSGGWWGYGPTNNPTLSIELVQKYNDGPTNNAVHPKRPYQSTSQVYASESCTPTYTSILVFIKSMLHNSILTEFMIITLFSVDQHKHQG